MEINMPFLKIQYRDYPKEGLFKKLYRENIYKIEEFKDEFTSRCNFREDFCK